jgi:hypothetical protein
LAYELPDGRLKLLDGHLHRDLDRDMEVEVEVLDVTDDGARTLLLSIDPLAALAQTQEQRRHRLLELAPAVPDELRAAWEKTACAAIDRSTRPLPAELAAQFLIVVTCRHERQQVELLDRLQSEGLACRAFMS